MKTKPHLIVLVLVILSQMNLSAQNFWVSDSIFRARLKLNLSTSCFTPQDSLISNAADLKLLQRLDLSSLGIQNIEGIQFLSSLKYLDFFDNQVSQIPTLPDSLLWLDCSFNLFIDSLPPLPLTLKHLNCGLNNIRIKPLLPAGLEYLNYSEAKIGGYAPLPLLPTSLDTLICYRDSLSSLPILPPTLSYLACGYNHLTLLPNLPPSLRYLQFEYNYISHLPALPAGLETLECVGNLLSTFPTLPPGLISLNCSYNQLTSLQALPPSLYYFFCDHNKLTSFPAFSFNLYLFDCSYNLLKGDFILPSNGYFLNCSHNQITSLNSIPGDVQELDCSFNLLSSIPFTSLNNVWFRSLACEHNNITNLHFLPSGMETLNCSNNPISCLPQLPQSMVQLTDSNTLISCVQNYPAQIQFSPANPVLCDSTASDCNSVYIKGYVFNDRDSNGIKTADERGIASEVIYSGSIVSADTSGFFRAFCNPTPQTFQISIPEYYKLTTPNPQSVTAINPSNTLYFGLIRAVDVWDLKIEITPNNPFRSGYQVASTIHYSNIGTQSVSPVIIKYKKAFNLLSISAQPPADSVSGDTLLWIISKLRAARGGKITLVEAVPQFLTIGSPLTQSAWIIPTAGDSVQQNNSFIKNSVVSGSFPPNYKSVSSSNVAANSTTFLEYNIRFQNTGTDTATTVIITDTLSPSLDVKSIEMLGASHNYSFWFESGIAKWYFSEINLPNAFSNEALSHGYITFRIKCKAGLPAGTVIPNSAAIYFDYKLPHITNTIVVNVTPLSVPMLADDKLKLFPNPVHEVVHLISEKPIGIVSLFNLEGKRVANKEIKSTSYDWSVEELPAGIYIFKGENWKEKVVKR